MRFKALHYNNQGAGKCIAFVVVVIFFVADASPSFSPATVTTPPIQGNAQKYSAIQLNTTVQLHYLMYIFAILTGCSIVAIFLSIFLILLPCFSQFMGLNLGIKIFPHNKTSIFS
jgi:hypothetical protein